MSSFFLEVRENIEGFFEEFIPRLFSICIVTYEIRLVIFSPQ